jgi:acetyl-CoA carboxylase carboxyltransferase component
LIANNPKHLSGAIDAAAKAARFMQLCDAHDIPIGFRKEMEAIADPIERETYYKEKIALLYANGKATSIASVLEIDEVIDPAETRNWIMGRFRRLRRASTASGLVSIPRESARIRPVSAGLLKR